MQSYVALLYLNKAEKFTTKTKKGRSRVWRTIVKSLIKWLLLIIDKSRPRFCIGFQFDQQILCMMQFGCSSKTNENFFIVYLRFPGSHSRNLHNKCRIPSTESSENKEKLTYDKVMANILINSRLLIKGQSDKQWQS